jgi:predicted nucleic acid-binding protein
VRLLDADILVDLLRRHPPALAWSRSLTEWPAVPGLVVMEVMQGCRNGAELRAVQKLVQPLTLIWPTEADCQRALQDFESFHLSHNLGLIDALVAACALGRGATLVTFNVKHYSVIVGLVTEQPYTR